MILRFAIRKLKTLDGDILDHSLLTMKREFVPLERKLNRGRSTQNAPIIAAAITMGVHGNTYRSFSTPAIFFMPSRREA